MSKVDTKEILDTLAGLEKYTISELGLKVLYIDLNSCFATTEQQARPMLRNRPVGIVNRLVEHSHIIAASIEAKKLGVKVGMRTEEAKQICPDIVFAESEPSKFFYVHKKLKNIMSDYSAKIVMKSIDEGLIDLTEATSKVTQKTVKELSTEIKERLKTEVGNYMKCNIGFSTNRFLSKMAGELHKPNGVDVILPQDIKINSEVIKSNIRDIFSKLKLTDLPGINVRMEKRLRTYSIDTPLQLLDAKEETLVKQVCKSIDGTKWYKRLRGEEVDDRESDIKTVGRQFILAPYMTEKDVRTSFMHLAEDVGYRLRSQNLYARGIQLWRTGGGYKSQSSDKKPNHITYLSKTAFNSDQDILELTMKLYKEITHSGRFISLTLYKLQKEPEKQRSFFEKDPVKKAKITEAVDNINARFGTRTVHSAATLGTDDVKVKVPFGSTRYIGKNKI